jgi:mono/diheme cytochrome c family protein
MMLMLVGLALLAAACGGAPDADTFGADLYDISCARCHGADLEGGIGPALEAGSNAATVLTDDQIFGAIRSGPGAMPTFPRLTDEQVSSVVDYLRERHGSG